MPYCPSLPTQSILPNCKLKIGLEARLPVADMDVAATAAGHIGFGGSERTAHDT
jgi:hypothetical protein